MRMWVLLLFAVILASLALWGCTVFIEAPDQEPVVSEVRKIAIKAAENGADMLISLCGNLTMILVSHGITEIEGIPFMDSVATAIKTAELLVDLKKIGIDRVIIMTNLIIRKLY